MARGVEYDAGVSLLNVDVDDVHTSPVAMVQRSLEPRSFA